VVPVPQTPSESQVSDWIAAPAAKTPSGPQSRVATNAPGAEAPARPAPKAAANVVVGLSADRKDSGIPAPGDAKRNPSGQRQLARPRLADPRNLGTADLNLRPVGGDRVPASTALIPSAAGAPSGLDAYSMLMKLMESDRPGRWGADDRARTPWVCRAFHIDLLAHSPIEPGLLARILGLCSGTLTEEQTSLWNRPGRDRRLELDGPDGMGVLGAGSGSLAAVRRRTSFILLELHPGDLDASGPRGESNRLAGDRLLDFTGSDRAVSPVTGAGAPGQRPAFYVLIELAPDRPDASAPRVAQIEGPDRSAGIQPAVPAPKNMPFHSRVVELDLRQLLGWFRSMRGLKTLYFMNGPMMDRLSVHGDHSGLFLEAPSQAGTMSLEPGVRPMDPAPRRDRFPRYRELQYELTADQFRTLSRRMFMGLYFTGDADWLKPTGNPDGATAAELDSRPADTAAADLPALESPVPTEPASVVVVPVAQPAERKRPRLYDPGDGKETADGQRQLAAPGSTVPGNLGFNGLGLEPTVRRTASAPATKAPSSTLEPLELEARSTLVNFRRAGYLTWNRPAGDSKSLLLTNDRGEPRQERVGHRDGRVAYCVQVLHRMTYTLSEGNPGGGNGSGPRMESKRPSETKATPRPQVTMAARGADFLAGDFAGPGHADGYLASWTNKHLPDRRARFLRPMGMAKDAQGCIYVADPARNVIRKIREEQVSTLAGNLYAPPGLEDARVGLARFNHPQGVAVSPDGRAIYVADTDNHAIRVITQDDKLVATLAGGTGAGKADGPGAQASFDQPVALALDLAGTSLYVADRGNGRIRRIALDGERTVSTLPVPWITSPAGMVVGRNKAGEERLYVSDDVHHIILDIPTATPQWPQLLAGNRLHPGSAAGTGSAASFNRPQALALTECGLLLVADTGNNTIRFVPVEGEEAGAVSNLRISETKSGQGAPRSVGAVLELGTDQMLVTDPELGLIWQVHVGSPQPQGGSPAAAGDQVSVRGLKHFAGTVAAPADCVDAVRQHARFNRASGILMARNGQALVADTGNGRIRRVGLDGAVDTLPVQNPKYPFEPLFLTDDGMDGVFFTNARHGTIEHIDREGRLTRVAGLPRPDRDERVPGRVGDALSTAQFWQPQGIARDDQGTLYVADGHCIRRIRNGRVDTLAGDHGRPGDLDLIGGAASFRSPMGLAWRDGHLYVADSENHAIRRVSAAGKVETVAGQLGQARTPEDKGGNHLSSPYALAFSPDGKQLYVTELDQPGVRRIALPDGTITTLVPGTPFASTAGHLPKADGTTCEPAAALGYGWGITCTVHGDLLVVTSPADGASGGVVQITSPEVEPKR
jgi:sugar lactone lactonase YvrE